VTRLKVSAAPRRISLPSAVDPVKVTFAMFGCRLSSVKENMARHLDRSNSFPQKRRIEMEV